uniref:BZIP domain-containing protein n=1 Tax=Heterosigma akashiwo TaxID=2829 RepID=A0A6V1P8S9_HETAK|mmetsp:Transcript_7019/g.10798  ORF Transcript_7019/g.10798 Transcript_7019/m.10798 type:complete len:321 (-) Transcript_7019:325-1287(-)
MFQACSSSIQPDNMYVQSMSEYHQHQAIMHDSNPLEDAHLLSSIKSGGSWTSPGEAQNAAPPTTITPILHRYGHAPSKPKRLNNLSTDEKSQRSRERNKIHARLTRLRKKNACHALQDYLFYLWSEVQFLRQMHQDYDTSVSLIKFSKRNPLAPVSSSSCLKQQDLEDALFNDITSNLDLKLDDLESFKSLLETHLRTIANSNLSTVSFPETKDPRKEELMLASGVPSSEVNKIQRRERNRIHAKLTRDRKKIIQKLTEQATKELEQEANKLRHLLVAQGFPLNYYTKSLVYGSRLDCLHHVVSTPQFKTSLGLRSGGVC